jgi:hypothetical protein
MGKFQTKVITDESQVPPGWMRVAQLCESLADQKKLSDAHTDGFIPAVKLMRSVNDKSGPVWVSPDDARLILQSDKLEPAKKFAADAAAAALMSSRQAESVIVALCEISNVIALSLTVLERLTTAVESMATQPRTEEQVREAITTACRNADGFDSFRS